VTDIHLIQSASLIWLAVAVLHPLYSQPKPLELVAPADVGISVVVYDPARHPELGRFFESPEAARLASYSIVLKNESSKHIVGVAVRWVSTDRTGQSRTTMQSFDSFGTSVAARQPVIPTGTQLIATPNGFQQVRVQSGGGFVGGFGQAEGVSSFGFGRGQLIPIDNLDQANGVTAIVDTIIFEDGRFIGPDESHLIEYINAVAGAVKALVKDLGAASSDGRDVDDILRNIASAGRTRSLDDLLDDPAGFWAIREARLLLAIPREQRKALLDQLERLSPPPSFYK